MSLKINLVLNPSNQSWIIGKIAERLQENLRQMGDDAWITAEPDHRADVTHHMSWAFARHRVNCPSTMFITHLDDIYKLNEVRDTLKQFVNVGICMSRDTMEQVRQHGAPADAVTFVSPAYDAPRIRQRIIIGLTTRLYPDGRKREHVLMDVAKKMSLEGFEFRIFGSGWERVIAELERASSTVFYYPETDDYRADYARIQESLPAFDYYLYLGMDEGSLGTLDALSAGVKTIVTPQGFHLDAPGGITHAVVTADDLERVFREIDGARRRRIAAVSTWTWGNYAARHRDIWAALLREEPPPPPASAASDSFDMDPARSFRNQTIYSNALAPRRILSAVSHIDSVRRLRKLFHRRGGAET